MSNLNYKIIDNALLENDARVIVDSMEHGSFPWYYNKSIAYGKKDLEKKITEEKEVGGYFNHLFYSNYSILSQDSILPLHIPDLLKQAIPNPYQPPCTEGIKVILPF